MRTLFLLAICLLFTINTSYSQTVNLEGYVFEEGNRGYLNLASVTIIDRSNKSMILKIASNMEGLFKAEIPIGKEYLVKVEKDLFVTKEEIVSTIGRSAGEKTFVKFKMARKPGYVFDVTIAEKSGKGMPADAVQGAKIEVFNNTSAEEVLVLENHPTPTFKTHFEEGNHYTILIRKKGFFNKRLEAFVNVKGCILCFEGVGNVRPSDVLTEGHSMGTLLANVELKPIELGKGIKVENIYYDTDKYRIKKAASEELNKLITVLKNNPSLVVELGSHTDSRGKDSYNLRLSQKRAKAAVDYILKNGGITKDRIKAKGYGESQIVNKCKNGVDCRDSQHQANRRTELKIVGFLSNNPYQNKSLADIIEEENYEKLLAEVNSGEQYKVPDSGALPPDLEKQLSSEASAKSEKHSKPPSASSTLPKQKTTTTAPIVNTNPPAVTTQPSVSVPAEPKARTTTRPAVNTKPTVSTTSAHSRSSKPFKPQTEQEVKPKDFSTSSEGFDESSFLTSDEADSRIIKEVVLAPKRSQARIHRLPIRYSGYRIEFFNAPFELPSSHQIFSKHGNITMEQKKDGSYAYLIGDFEDWRDANKFLTNILLQRYPDARVIRYKKGNRLVK